MSAEESDDATGLRENFARVGWDESQGSVLLNINGKVHRMAPEAARDIAKRLVDCARKIDGWSPTHFRRS